MTYKENLFFIARCLTLSLDKKNQANVLSTINSKKLNWDAIVKISSNHLLLPTLYCNLKDAKLLKYLPKDLVEYMNKIKELNKKKTDDKKTESFFFKPNFNNIFLISERS